MCPVCVWHLVVLGSVSVYNNFVTFIVVSNYPCALFMMLGGLIGLCHGGLHSGTDLQWSYIHLNYLAIDIIFPHIIILTFSLEFAIEVSAGVVRECGHGNSTWPSTKHEHTHLNTVVSNLKSLFYLKSSIAITLSRTGGMTLASAGITVPKAGLKIPSAGVTLPSAGLTLHTAGVSCPSAVIALWPKLKSWRLSYAIMYWWLFATIPLDHQAPLYTAAFLPQDSHNIVGLCKGSKKV